MGAQLAAWAEKIYQRTWARDVAQNGGCRDLAKKSGDPAQAVRCGRQTTRHLHRKTRTIPACS
jgi:hypothetical protein